MKRFTVFALCVLVGVALAMDDEAETLVDEAAEVSTLRGVVRPPISNRLKQENLCSGINSHYNKIDDRAIACRRNYFCTFHSGRCAFNPAGREMDSEDFFLGPDQSPQFWQFCEECKDAFEAGYEAAAETKADSYSDTFVTDRTTSFNPHRAWSVNQDRQPAFPAPDEELVEQFEEYLLGLADDPQGDLTKADYGWNKKAKNIFSLKDSRENPHINKKFAIEPNAVAFFPGIGNQPLPWFYAGSIAGYLSVHKEVAASLKDHFMYMDLDYAQGVPDGKFHREIPLSFQWHFDDATTYDKPGGVGMPSGTELMVRNTAPEYFITMSALPTQFFYGTPEEVVSNFLKTKSEDKCCSFETFTWGRGYSVDGKEMDGSLVPCEEVKCTELINKVVPKMMEACPTNFKEKMEVECKFEEFQNELLQPMINNLIFHSDDFRELWLAESGDSTTPGSPIAMGPYRWHFSGLNKTGKPVNRWFMRWVFKTFRHYGFNPNTGTGPDMTD